MSSALAQAVARSSSQRGHGLGADHIERPLNRIGRHRQRRRPAPPEARARRCRCGWGRRTHRPPHNGAPAPRPFWAPGTSRRDSARSSAARAGPSPTTTLVPGRSSERNASMFFSTATRPTLSQMGRGKGSARALDRAGRDRHPPRATRCAHCRSHGLPVRAASEGVATIIAVGRIVEPAQEATDETLRHEGQPRMHIFGKARVEGCGEGNFLLHANRARGKPHRAFGGDVNGVGLEIRRSSFRGSCAGTAQAGFRDRWEAAASPILPASNSAPHGPSRKDRGPAFRACAPRR